MRSFALGLVAALALAAGLQDAGAAPSLRNSDPAAHISQNLVLAKPAMGPDILAGHAPGPHQYFEPAGPMLCGTRLTAA